MAQERIQITKRIPIQRTYEYEQPFPAKEVSEEELQALGDLVLEHIDTCIEEAE